MFGFSGKTKKQNLAGTEGLKPKWRKHFKAIQNLAVERSTSRRRRLEADALLSTWQPESRQTCCALPTQKNIRVLICLMVHKKKLRWQGWFLFFLLSAFFSFFPGTNHFFVTFSETIGRCLLIEFIDADVLAWGLLFENVMLKITSAEDEDHLNRVGEAEVLELHEIGPRRRDLQGGNSPTFCISKIPLMDSTVRQEPYIWK